MSLQARKLSLIKEFLKITDESLIGKVEVLIREERKKKYENAVEPMTVNEFQEMIAISKKDSDEGRVISHEDLEKKIKSWK